MCTVITRGTSFDTGQPLPVILDDESLELWLNPEETRTDVLQSMLQALPDADFRTYPVTPFVENAAWETPDCIEEVHPSLALVKI